MKNIVKIAKEDFKRVGASAITLLVVIGLICIPSIYSWLSLCGFWDPYANTSNLQIAVVNTDKGYKNNYLPIDINVGKSVISTLSDNSAFKWNFSDNKEETISELDKGKYYAAIVIPENFSTEIMSVLFSTAKPAKLIYYSNEKVNEVVPKLTDRGASAVQAKINTSFKDILLNAVLKVTKNAADLSTSGEAKQLVEGLGSSFSNVSSYLKSAVIQLDGVKATLSSFNGLIDAADNTLPYIGTQKEQEIKNAIAVLKAEIAKGKQTILNVIKYMKQRGAPQEAIALGEKIYSILCDVDNITDSAIRIIDNSINTTTDLHATLSSVRALTSNLDARIGDISSDFSLVAKDLDTAKRRIDALTKTTTIDDLKKIIGDDPDNLASLLVSPVSADRKAVYPIVNNGSAMAAFYTSLAIWVGPVLLAAMMKVRTSKERYEEMQREHLAEQGDGEGLYSRLEYNEIQQVNTANFAALNTNEIEKNASPSTANFRAVDHRRQRAASRKKGVGRHRTESVDTGTTVFRKIELYMKGVKQYEIFFGRYVMFGFLSLLQATLVAFGSLFFLKIQCVNPVLFLLTCWLYALVFSFLIYTLVVSFANTGKAIAVVLLVLQVAGSGAIFPHELLHPFFASIYPYLPFSWTIEAFHYCIAGFNPTTGLAHYLFLIGLPVLIIVPVCLLFGLVLRIPIIKLNDKFVSKMKKTGVLG